MKISNNSLVILLAVAIIVSITGTIVSVSFMDAITGAATTSGTTLLEVNVTVSCSATDSSINLGNITRGNYNRSEEITIPDFIVIENTGNVLENLTGYSTENLFISSVAPTQNWTMQCNSTQSGTCVTGFKIINASSATAETIISNLNYAAATDEFNISVNATVPVGESAGMKSGTITFLCTYSQLPP